MIDETDRGGPARVGWLLGDKKHRVLFEAPERVRSADMNRDHAKSASRCPAVLNLESRYFVVKCPFTIQLGFERDGNRKGRLKNKMGDKSPVRPSKLADLVTLMPEAEWRYRDRPTIQIKTPYIFIADEPVFLTQVPPFMRRPHWWRRRSRLRLRCSRSPKRGLTSRPYSWRDYQAR